jgi:hypothetical protein
MFSKRTWGPESPSAQDDGLVSGGLRYPTLSAEERGMDGAPFFRAGLGSAAQAAWMSSRKMGMVNVRAEARTLQARLRRAIAIAR